MKCPAYIINLRNHTLPSRLPGLFIPPIRPFCYGIALDSLKCNHTVNSITILRSTHRYLRHNSDILTSDQIQHLHQSTLARTRRGRNNKNRCRRRPMSPIRILRVHDRPQLFAHLLRSIFSIVQYNMIKYVKMLDVSNMKRPDLLRADLGRSRIHGIGTPIRLKVTNTLRNAIPPIKPSRSTCPREMIGKNSLLILIRPKPKSLLLDPSETIGINSGRYINCLSPIAELRLYSPHDPKVTQHDERILTSL